MSDEETLGDLIYKLPYWMKPCYWWFIGDIVRYFYSPAENFCFGTLLIAAAMLPMITNFIWIAIAIASYGILHLIFGIWRSIIIESKRKTYEKQKLKQTQTKLQAGLLI